MKQDSNDLYYMQLSTDHMNMTKWLTNEQRGILFGLVFAYFCGEMTEQEVIKNIPPEHNILLPIWSNMQISINRSKAAYSEKCRINKENGKKGGAPKGNHNARKKKEYSDKEYGNEDNNDDCFQLDTLSDDELEKIQNQNSTLAFLYQRMSIELKERGYSVRMFFNWNQLLRFMAVFSYINIVCFKTKESVFSVSSGGLDDFINTINKLGTDKMISFLENAMCKKEKNIFVENDNIKKILLDVAEIDEELQTIVNNG